MGAINRRKKGLVLDCSVAEVATLWSGSILDVTQLGSDRGELRQFTVGEDPACNRWVEPETIGDRSTFNLVTIDGNRLFLTIPLTSEVTLERPGETISGGDLLVEQGLARASTDGFVTLVMEEGWVAEVTLGEISFRVRRTEAGQLDKAALPIEWSSVNWTGASFLVHAIFLALIFAIPPTSHGISLDGSATGERFISYLVAPPEIEPPPPIDLRPDTPTATEEPVERGSAHEGVGGAMGSETAPDRNTHYAIRNRGGDEVRLGREELRQYAATSGILSVLNANVPTSPFGSTTPNGLDAEDALGHLMGIAPGDAFGYGGLTVRGTGRGGNGRDGNITIGLDFNTIGRVGNRNMNYGADRGLVEHRSRRSTGPAVRVGTASVNGALSREVIRREIRLRRNEISHCYQSELNRRPDLAGRVSVRFIIDQRGIVVSSSVSESTMGSAEVSQCVAGVIRRISFPVPDGGVVMVNYPFTFVSQD